MNELIPHVIADTGTKILLKRISPFLVMELQKQFPKPEVPTQTIDIGGETKEEPNYAHPDYEASLIKWRDGQEARIRKLIIKRGVVIPPENTTWEEELAEKRQGWVEDFGVELPHIDDDDKVDWVLYCAIGTNEDYEEIYHTVLRRSQPTTEAVEAAKAGFPG